MLNGQSGHPIEEHPRGGCGKKRYNPIPETSRETPFLKKVNKVSPFLK
jgi:hypothetical protein